MIKSRVLSVAYLYWLFVHLRQQLRQHMVRGQHLTPGFKVLFLMKTMLLM